MILQNCLNMCLFMLWVSIRLCRCSLPRSTSYYQPYNVLKSLFCTLTIFLQLYLVFFLMNATLQFSRFRRKICTTSIHPASVTTILLNFFSFKAAALTSHCKQVHFIPLNSMLLSSNIQTIAIVQRSKFHLQALLEHTRTTQLLSTS